LELGALLAWKFALAHTEPVMRVPEDVEALRAPPGDIGLV
jgi:hypothetical protein